MFLICIVQSWVDHWVRYKVIFSQKLMRSSSSLFYRLCQGANTFGSVVCSLGRYVPRSHYLGALAQAWPGIVFCSGTKVLWVEILQSSQQTDDKDTYEEVLTITITITRANVWHQCDLGTAHGHVPLSDLIRHNMRGT